MTVNHFEILVEEPSMEAFLNELLPRVLPSGRTFVVHPFQGKPDLLKKLAARLRAYSKWLPSDYRLIIVIDRDNDDCRKLKKQMQAIARDSGLRAKSTSTENWQLANRIAIEELEAWYFGEWKGVRTVYPRVSSTIPSKAAFRNPDAIQGGTWEAFERVLQQYGYFAGGLRKTEAARIMGSVFHPARCSSTSFIKFHEALAEAVAETLS